jgi:hypothetical protein
MTRQNDLSNIPPNCDTNPNLPSQNSFLLYNNFSYLHIFWHESPEFYLWMKKVDPETCQLSYFEIAKFGYNFF